MKRVTHQPARRGQLMTARTQRATTREHITAALGALVGTLSTSLVIVATAVIR